MAVLIKIQNNVIEFPDSSASPNWAPALVEFAQAVEAALATVVGGFDVAPQLQNIDAHNPGVDVEITSLNFPVTSVRNVTIHYAVYRTTDSAQVAEGGKIEITYVEDNPAGNKWEYNQVRSGDAKISFKVTDLGQLEFTTETLPGINHTGFISFRAIALENN